MKCKWSYYIKTLLKVTKWGNNFISIFLNKYPIRLNLLNVVCKVESQTACLNISAHQIFFPFTYSKSCSLWVERTNERRRLLFLLSESNYAASCLTSLPPHIFNHSMVWSRVEWSKGIWSKKVSNKKKTNDQKAFDQKRCQIIDYQHILSKCQITSFLLIRSFDPNRNKTLNAFDQMTLLTLLFIWNLTPFIRSKELWPFEIWSFPFRSFNPPPMVLVSNNFKPKSLSAITQCVPACTSLIQNCGNFMNLKVDILRVWFIY